jgi:hypothetical protein
MLAGGVQVQQGQVSADAIAYVNGNVAHINSIFHVENAGYNVISEGTQVVAGTNHFLHLVGHTDGRQYTITVHVPIGGNPVIIEVSEGHNNLGHGHGLTIEAYHQHHHHHHHHG